MKTARVKITLVFVEETGTFVVLVVFGLFIRVPTVEDARRTALTLIPSESSSPESCSVIDNCFTRRRVKITLRAYGTERIRIFLVTTRMPYGSPPHQTPLLQTQRSRQPNILLQESRPTSTRFSSCFNAKFVCAIWKDNPDTLSVLIAPIREPAYYTCGVDTSSESPRTSRRSGGHAFVGGPNELEFDTVRGLQRREVVNVDVDTVDTGVRVAGVDIGGKQRRY